MKELFYLLRKMFLFPAVLLAIGSAGYLGLKAAPADKKVTMEKVDGNKKLLWSYQRQVPFSKALVEKQILDLSGLPDRSFWIKEAEKVAERFWRVKVCLLWMCVESYISYDYKFGDQESKIDWEIRKGNLKGLTANTFVKHLVRGESSQVNLNGSVLRRDYLFSDSIMVWATSKMMSQVEESFINSLHAEKGRDEK
ncbi:MAG: hypothetical protein AB8E15_02080 [Bdellovibrionales bacterium]